VATALPDRAKVGSVGRPLLFVRVRIAGEVDVRAGGDVPPGAQGEIVVSGPTVMQGYLDPAATAQVMRSGELFTGDVGYSDEAGDLFVLRRRTDLILSGGENVYPAEVEAVLKQHAWVNDACVVGLPHAEWGQQVAAAIVLKRGALGDVGPHEVGPREVALQLEQHCRAHLAGYKVPRRFKFVDELPRAGAGKIDRRAVAVAFDAASFA
jgi:O-succinylbenzoic acid--CoA ligase